jgi:tetratricopeptide (TPR) repeat protein
MAEQLRVFVSHSHEDDAFCRTLVEALRDAGADVWYDEHNLGSGRLHDVLLRELGHRPIFVVILSKGAFASRWVKRETDWAEELADRDPSRLLLPVTAGQIARDDFGAENGWLAYYSYKRIEAPGFAPYLPDEAARRLLRTLGLTPRGEAPAPVAPQPTESVDDLLTRGKVLVAKKQYTEARPLFERASQLAPGSFDAWAMLGYLLGELGRWQELLTACDRALALDGSNAPTWVNKGRAFGGLGRFQEELVALDRALALDPNLAMAWNNKGAALNGLKRSDEALVACDRALALDPNNATVWINKGVALGGMGRHQEAITAYERALTLDPTNGMVWKNKANRLRALGRTAEAEEAEQRARELGWTG